MENIRYGRLDATDEEVIAAAKLAHCDEFVEKMPDFCFLIFDFHYHITWDLLDVTDFLNALMKYLKYDKTDYEIDYKGNHLIMAIYTNKTITKADVA